MTPGYGVLLGWAMLVLVISGYGVGGIYAPYALLLLTAMALPWLVYDNTGRRLVPSRPASGLVAAFVILATTFQLSSQRPDDVLIVANFVWLLLFIPLFALFRRLATPGAALWIARLALAGVAATFALALYELLAFRVERVGYITSDAIRIANTAVILGFVGLVGVIVDRGWMRAIYLAGPVLAIGVALLAGTRNAIIVTCVLAALAGLLLVRNRRVALLAALGLAIAGAAALLIGAQLRIPRIDSLVETLLQIARGEPVTDVSAYTRLAMMSAGWQAFLDSPWIGHGWQRMMSAILPYLPPGQETLTAGQPHLHNDILDFAVAGGLLGLLAYVIIIATPLVAAIHSVRDSLYRPRLFAMIMLVAAYAGLGLNSLMFGFEIHTSLYVAMSALILGFCRDDSGLAEPRPVMPDATRRNLIGCIILALLLFLLPAPAGRVTPFILDLAALVVIVIALVRGRLFASYRESASALFVLALGILALCFTLTMHAPADLAFIVNFVPLLFCGPLALAFLGAASPRNASRVAWLALGGAAVIAGFAYFNAEVLAVPRGAVKNFPPITMSNTAILFGFFALGGIWGSQNPWRWLLILGPALGIATALITESRGPLIGVLPLALLAAWFLWRHAGVRGSALTGAGVAAVVVLVGAVVFAPGRVASLVGIVTDVIAGDRVSDFSSATRLALYEAGFAAFRESPWLGHGWARLMDAALVHLPEEYLEHARGLPQLHNDVVNFAVAAGAVGVATYVLMLITPLIGALRSPIDSQRAYRIYGALVIAIGYATAGLTEIMIGFEFHTTMLAFLTAVLVGFCRDTAPARVA